MTKIKNTRRDKNKISRIFLVNSNREAALGAVLGLVALIPHPHNLHCQIHLHLRLLPPGHQDNLLSPSLIV